MLPDAARDMAMPHAKQVEFEDADGPVSVASSDTIPAQLAGRVSSSEILDKHLAYEQALNADSPMVLGKELTLLQNGPAT